MRYVNCDKNNGTLYEDRYMYSVIIIIIIIIIIITELYMKSDIRKL